MKKYDNAVEARLSLYDELNDRIRKIRLALVAQYDKTSNECNDSLRY